jgi:hypothetical protein
MCAPTSAMLAETYNQQIEHKEIYPILIKHQITGYCRYVVDCLIIYDKRTNTDKTLIQFNIQQVHTKFAIEKEINYSINFLGLTAHRKKTNLEFAICRTHIKTGIIRPNDSCHSHKQKTSRINYLLNRLRAYPTSGEAKEKKIMS